MNPKIDISIIIPMYNAEKYILETILSIINQKPHPFSTEIIVVDDGSTDFSRQIVENIIHPQIQLIALKNNSGISIARNEGLKAASGVWIQFMDSDDTISNDLYQNFYLAMKPNVNCYLFSLEHKYEHHKFRQTIQQIHDKRAFGHFGSVCNKIFKKELCLDFKEGYLYEDTIFIIDVFIHQKLNLGLIDDSYYYYNRTNSQSITANFNHKAYDSMLTYIYSQIGACDDLTKMFILEIFLAMLVKKDIIYGNKFKVVLKTIFKLYRYLPSVLLDQNRKKLINTRYDY